MYGVPDELEMSKPGCARVGIGDWFGNERPGCDCDRTDAGATPSAGLTRCLPRLAEPAFEERDGDDGRVREPS